jgi:hypothetical protein
VGRAKRRLRSPGRGFRACAPWPSDRPRVSRVASGSMTIGVDISDARPEDEQICVGSWEWHIPTDEFHWSPEIRDLLATVSRLHAAGRTIPRAQAQPERVRGIATDVTQRPSPGRGGQK